jgi:hypothetical protein
MSQLESWCTEASSYGWMISETLGYSTNDLLHMNSSFPVAAWNNAPTTLIRRKHLAQFQINLFFSFNLCGRTLGTAATSGLLYQPWMIGEDDCGEIWWNQDWQGNPKYSEKTCPSATLSTTNPTRLDPGLNSGRRGGKPATNRLSYGATSQPFRSYLISCRSSTSSFNNICTNITYHLLYVPLWPTHSVLCKITDLSFVRYQCINYSPFIIH